MKCPIIPLSDKVVILPKDEGEQMYGNIIVPDAGKEKTLSYHGDLEHAIKKISYLSIISKEQDYTLTGFIESYKNIVEKLTKNFKI